MINSKTLKASRLKLLRPYKWSIFFLFLLCSLNVYSQQTFQKLLNDFRTSVELPEYYNGKFLMTRSPIEVRNMTILEDKLTFQYEVGNQTYKNTYFIEIDLQTSIVKKGEGYNYNVWFENNDGIIVRKVGKENETILVDSFIFTVKSEGMKERIYKEMLPLIAPYQSNKTEKGSPTQKTIKKGTQQKTTKQSKSRKYEQ